MQEAIEEPHDNDVLCGRGGYINSHPGNELFRKLVERRKRVYLAARFKREKRLVANSIVSEIRALDGHFLAKDSKTGKWYDIGDEKARDKTSQALRENAPSIRAEIKDGNNQRRKQKPKAETSNSTLKDTADCNFNEKCKNEPKANDAKSSQQAKAPPHWNQSAPYCQQPQNNYYPPYNGYGPQYIPHPYPQEGGPQGQWNARSPAPDHGPTPQGSSMVAPAPFSQHHAAPPMTDYIQSTTAQSSTPVITPSAWPGNQSPHVNSSMTAMNQAVAPSLAKPQADLISQNQNQLNISHGGHTDKHHGVLSEGGNTMMGSWDYPILPQQSMEEEVGQEVELVEMDYQMEDHRPISNINKINQLPDSESRMLPPPLRPRQKKTEQDWTSRFMCQSSWLPIPDSFSTAGNHHSLSPTTSYDMDTSAVGTVQTETGISLTGSIGGASLTQVFDHDASPSMSLSRANTGSMGGASFSQVFDQDAATSSSLSRVHTGSMGGASLTQVFDQDTSTSGSLSKAHSLISSAHSVNSASSINYQDSFKVTSFDEHCRSPSFSERSFASKSSVMDCQMSSGPTSTSIANLGSKSSGSRSYRHSPLEGGFH
eukprot:CAMPEP_0194201976 /NCGR_PEP_ID=MMETSP0156-20130528/2120_1 /TAXON_ID=33649 /ORGANISM="Thalassionema nitzschioides, Strain L26-B" /LENGTH=596 /DNA_ID=CAMNT_0038927329 /DNA_START=181 /DNA_END=1971 /DNA_ORIENTATION=-